MKRFWQRLRPGFSPGFNLVVLVMAITVMNILISMALPLMSTQIKRDREEELIFRGLQYAEGLRLFQQRFGRLPVRLEELVEADPRCMRQLWKNPMTENGGWGILTLRQAAPRPNQQGGNPTQQNPPANPQQPPRPGGGGVALVPSATDYVPGQEVSLTDGPKIQGPIAGVFSREGGSAVKTFNGSNEVAEWQFTADLLTQAGNAAAGTGRQPTQQTWPVNAGTFWKPFPPGLAPPGFGGGSGGPGIPGVSVGTGLPGGGPGRPPGGGEEK